ncbi:MAG: ankyrin repeat domain-containing protein, partial [Methylococcales bacterium]
EKAKPILLTGSLGVGKSQFLQYLLSLLPDGMQSLHLAESCLTYSEKICLLAEQLPEVAEKGKKLVVIIDNAQEISGHDLQFLLEACGNPVTVSPIQLIFCGLFELADKLKSIDSQFFSEENTHHYSLIGLNESQVSDYIQYRLQRVGYCEASRGELFLPEAVSRVTALSHGIPHTINLLCGASLLIASFDDKRQVDAQIVQEAASSCLLPVDMDDLSSIVDVLAAPTAAEQLNVAVNLRKRPRQTRRFNQRMANWKRLSSVHRRRLPIDQPRLGPDMAEIEQARSKRLVRGVAALGVSLSFLITVQHFEQPAPDNKTAMVLKNQSVLAAQKTAPPSAMQANVSLAPPLVAATDSVEKNKLIAAAPANNTPGSNMHAVAQESKAPVVLAKADAVRVSQDSSANSAATKKTTNSAKDKLLRRLLVDQIVKQTLAKANTQTINASTARALAPVSSGSSSFQQVNADLSGFINTKKSNPTTYALDAQEMAARDRAASRFNLNKLGVEYSVESLMAAARAGDLHVVKLLLSGGVPADIKNRQGETALMIAARHGYKSVVKELLDKGAHPDIKDKQGLTALMHANQHRFTEISTLLSRYDARG